RALRRGKRKPVDGEEAACDVDLTVRHLDHLVEALEEGRDLEEIAGERQAVRHDGQAAGPTEAPIGSVAAAASVAGAGVVAATFVVSSVLPVEGVSGGIGDTDVSELEGAVGVDAP